MNLYHQVLNLNRRTPLFLDMAKHEEHNEHDDQRSFSYQLPWEQGTSSRGRSKQRTTRATFQANMGCRVIWEGSLDIETKPARWFLFKDLAGHTNHMQRGDGFREGEALSDGLLHKDLALELLQRLLFTLKIMV